MTRESFLERRRDGLTAQGANEDDAVGGNGRNGSDERDYFTPPKATAPLLQSTITSNTDSTNTQYQSNVPQQSTNWRYTIFSCFLLH